MFSERPMQTGLYDPANEHDSCGVGFVVDIKGKKSNKIVKDGLQVLLRMEHRGAVGSDPETGDGAGILIQIPDEFFRRICTECKIPLPSLGEYGTGIAFLPTIGTEKKFCKTNIERIIEEEGQTLLGWRPVPVNPAAIGATARKSMPEFEQVFIGKSDDIKDALAFERKLYVIRKRIENEVSDSTLKQKKLFYFPNISCRTFSYKGMAMSGQVSEFFLDLQDEGIKSAICMVHSRYSTNTFPSWELAQPFRYLAHNGEINTLRGNINWTRAREGLLSSEVWGKDIDKVKPVVVDGLSDSATIDRVFELLVLSGRSLPHAMMMLIPSAWEQNDLMDPKHKDFYKYHSCLCEPWDGPASMSFTDGVKIGAVLDRNGLRPSRYIVTKDDRVIMASEVGVLDIEPENILKSGRLEPGKIFFIDTEAGRIVDDQEIKDSMAAQAPYGKWLKDNLVELDKLEFPVKPQKEKESTLSLLKAFGYTREDLRVLVGPMAETGKEPIGSMGNDTPHAVLSKKPQLLYTYFKQLFAQVTNPPIDPIREEIVMSYNVMIGPEGNILAETPEQARRLNIKEPVLTNGRLENIRALNTRNMKTKTVPTLFDPENPADFKSALDRVCAEAEKAIEEGFTFVILSDRGVDKENAALPALIATGAVHQHLVRKALRTRIGIILETGEPREVHHFCTLFGFGADAVNPYLIYDAISFMIEESSINVDWKKGQENFIDAINHGIYKVMSKMGISTLQSYKGAQIFEALGVHPEVIERCFTHTASRIGGAGFDNIYKSQKEMHDQGFPKIEGVWTEYLPAGGLYQWRKDGEFHLWNPVSIALIQDSTRTGDYNKFKQFSQSINDQSGQPTTLRSLLKFKPGKRISIDEVEPKEEIFKRFVTGAMSFGSISRGAHETMGIALNRLGGMSNTGEGGEDPERFAPLPNGDTRCSKIKQIASGRFGVTTNYLINAEELQIKIAQGAKPGEGGQLPGHKVSTVIAKTRYTTPGVTLISPPPHHDIYSIEDLAQLIFDLKNTNPKARISVKLVSEVGVGTIAAGVAKGHADMILISGGDGGTGASPLSSIKHAGLPWELGIAETHQTLVLNDLRSRVRLQTDGQIRTGRDVAIAAMLGAEEYGMSTAALIVMGCVMLRHCHLNNCSVGVATQSDILQTRFKGRPEYLVNLFNFVADELREIMAELGFRTLNEMIGRTDMLEVNEALLDEKTRNIDFSKILYRPEVPREVGFYKTTNQVHKIGNVLDRKLIEICQPALMDEKQVCAELPISNTNRTVGAMLSGEICRRYGERALPEDTIHVKFKGYAGQSFGAWLVKGVTFELEGMTNDYLGKGIFGGRIIVYPDKKTDYIAEQNIIIGNTSFYGAIRGEAYIRGRAGERFCIRNSGLLAVVEGVGDHGCEYMTGGIAVILGTTGRNFAAGMSGGVAYVWDVNGDFHKKCNTGMVQLEGLDEEDTQNLNSLIRNHYQYTDSAAAKRILDNFGVEIAKFIKVMPVEYRRVKTEALKMTKRLGLSEALDG
ncbi:MAG: glutamate synthase subunit alpha [Spirochaetes bacterium GWF1_51_8]|nr:MAG: glutamate synthase subunit alpha [Spirochaetes bacterium GWF1_51_8]